MEDGRSAVEASGLGFLTGRLRDNKGFEEVLASLAAGQAATIDGAWGSASALVVAALARAASQPILCVCPHSDDVDEIVEELRLFGIDQIDSFVVRETVSGDSTVLDETAGERLRLLKRLLGSEPPRVVVASVSALLQPVPEREAMQRRTRCLSLGDDVEIAALSRWLLENGFSHTTGVELPGEFSVRGGIVDIFAPDWDHPVRVEFFGDRIESLRSFDAASQRSLLALGQIELTTLGPPASDRGHLAAYLPPESWVALVEPSELEEAASHFRERMERPEECHGYREVIESLVARPSATIWALAPGSLETTCHLAMESVERFSGDIGRVRDELDAAGESQEVFVVCQTTAETERLAEVFGKTRIAERGKLRYVVGRIRYGFRMVSNALAVISSNEIFHRTDLQRRTARRRLGRVLDSFMDLRENDLVVHLAHGIARYRGLKLLEKAGHVEEHLVLEFHGGTKVYVPASKIGLVQKYVGATKSRPVLARLGGRLWSRQKEKVEEAVGDLAVEMLELQAARRAKPGIAFPSDTDWQREFDASFPYQETDDQLTTIDAIKTDMVRSRPMDRLLCGDVGYGKTEVAMRAAFKAIDAGYQVAVLVPTTILAEQHHRTFTARMAEFPFTIASLSRFGTRREQGDVLSGLAAGSIDVVIGTHRLAQPDVQFHNLGLVIIDEEQRFGVEIKERLKALRQTVDVLTMTATPIPRTLHMSLLGLRDISNLETPPADRLAVETRVARFDAGIIRHAVLRELNRNGQIFFVHNRVNDIEILAKRLRQIVPEATIGIAHGQMHENDLEQIMVDFLDHRYDMLLATTIIESGLDIPNANTIFIDEADRYGLADLHQLRGRVGRYKHRAYCYLLIDPNKHLPANAAKRLRAIEEFSDMGAGFAIAMRDLEIRGAGNILGSEQSGHIAVVGYELYCQLLEETVRRLKALPPRETIDVELDLPGEAHLPHSFIPDLRMKIDLYRRIARITTSGDLQDLRGEIVDRFGPMPAVVERLLDLADLRIAAHAWQIRSIHLEEHFAVLGYSDEAKIRQLAARTGGWLRVVDSESAYLPMAHEVMTPDAIFAELKSLLRQA